MALLLVHSYFHVSGCYWPMVVNYFLLIGMYVKYEHQLLKLTALASLCIKIYFSGLPLLFFLKEMLSHLM